MEEEARVEEEQGQGRAEEERKESRAGEGSEETGEEGKTSGE